ncbi:TIGR02444 family protein [Azorhizobium doebereinerae]|uniref:TIGR02444 family protein n=1 Tax=Azorhizobium doebereinerae TaxID=281091 RepID=UPI0003FA7A92|nr:TIGR02444 family protein [Azorhizobium doebereinerae]
MSAPASPMDGLIAREPLPAFALAVYGTAGVPPACLLLQERRGIDVNLLLFAAFLGAVRGEALTPAGLARAIETVGPWHGEVVRGLRAVRQRLKAGPPPAPNTVTAALRAKVQAVEIEAELIELSELGRLAHTLGAPPAAGPPDTRARAAMAGVVAGAPLDEAEQAALACIAAAAQQAATAREH